MRFVLLFVAVPALPAVGCAVVSGLGDLEIVACDGGSCTASVEDGSVPPGADGSTLGRDGAVVTPDARVAADAPNGADGADGALVAVDAGDAAVTTGPCAGNAGPKAVRVGTFCVDSTEVTNAEYASFLAASPAVSLGGSACGFKASFTPSQGWPASSAKAAFPVVYVDWCDAYAYCAWAGKRLCGAIGGGASKRASVADKAVDEWFVACSMNGANVFPYGAAYASGKCNDYESGAGGTRAVASSPKCEGGYPGIFDMNGNVWEWEDACDVSAGASDACLIRGGSFLFSGATYGGCPTYFNDYVVKRSDNFNDTGFRCCSN